MSIKRLLPDDFETFTIETNPRRTYTSSSSGVTGSVFLYSRRSSIEKEIYPLAAFSRSYYTDHNLDEVRRDALRLYGNTNITNAISGYLDAVTAQGTSVRKQQKVEIIRFNPPLAFDTDSVRKTVTCNTLMKYYRSSYPRAHFNYSNYHCLNFFTASNVPSDSVLLYPNPLRTDSTTLTDYGVTGSFSFDFWIRPKCTTELRDASAVYVPGCVMHLTSSYAITLHSGSSKDVNGRPNAFKLLLQLTNSADTSPEAANALIGSDPFIFASSDNSLPKDEWSHVTIRWGGTNRTDGSGSFIINDANCGNFAITNSLSGVGNQNYGNPSVLCVGNYYQGQNAGANLLDYFFTSDTATREGLYEIDSGTGFSPTTFAFNYPLNAELHELKLYESYLSDAEIEALSTNGPSSIGSTLRFYLPPFFTEESPTRQQLSSEGGVLQSPFYAKTGTTKHPFTVDMAFGPGGHYINLENYVRDLATGRYARLWNLSASVRNATDSTTQTANTILYSTGSIRKRLYSILPCDNGAFFPNFNLLSSLSSSTFTSDFGSRDQGVISLRNLITGSVASDIISDTDNVINTELFGPRPGHIGVAPNNNPNAPDNFAVYHSTRDPDSSQVVMFDISNLFYGNTIKPGTFVLTDTGLSASDGKVTMALKDDGEGNLYRADAPGTNATWSSVGNIFYNEGIVLIKHPQLYFFGANQYEVEFQGTQNIHVLTVNAYARSLQLVSSSNPSYRTGSLDTDPLANQTDEPYVYVTHVNLMDNNLNNICKTALAQPIVKRSGESLLFKIKIDF